jgi:hypothetical protein
MNLLQALPRTPLWDRLKRERRLIENDDNLESNVVFKMPYDEVVVMWRECMRVAYQPEALFGRYEHQVRVAYANRKRLPNSPQRASWRNIRRALIMLSRIFWFVGVRAIIACLAVCRRGCGAARSNLIRWRCSPTISFCLPAKLGRTPQRVELQHQADQQGARCGTDRRFSVRSQRRRRRATAADDLAATRATFTASPRSLVPLVRKRNSLSIPRTLDALVTPARRSAAPLS